MRPVAQFVDDRMPRAAERAHCVLVRTLGTDREHVYPELRRGMQQLQHDEIDITFIEGRPRRRTRLARAAGPICSLSAVTSRTGRPCISATAEALREPGRCARPGSTRRVP